MPEDFTLWAGNCPHSAFASWAAEPSQPSGDKPPWIMNQSPLRSCRRLPAICTPQSSLLTTLHQVIALGLWNVKISDKFCHFKGEFCLSERRNPASAWAQGVSVFLISGILLLTQQWVCYRLLLLLNPCKYTNPHLCTIKAPNLNTRCWESDAGGRGINTGRRNKEEHRWKSSSTWKTDHDWGGPALAPRASPAWGTFLISAAAFCASDLT